MEEKIKALENLLADLEKESREIRSVLDKPRELQTALVQQMVEEMRELLGRLKAIEEQLETQEGT
jgi:hypothetical protein